MGKRLEDLDGVDDQPRRPDPDDLRDQGWFQLLEQIDDLLAEERYAWAEATLSGIRRTVEESRTVTVGQSRAVQNIAAAGRERASGGRYSRRYEGWTR